MFCVQLYTLLSYLCNNYFVREHFYQTLLKLASHLTDNCYINTITVTIINIIKI